MSGRVLRPRNHPGFACEGPTDRTFSHLTRMKHFPSFAARPGPLLGLLLTSLLGFGCVTSSEHGPRAALGRALTFHASFDNQVDADFALGDRRLQSAPQWGHPRNVHPGLPTNNAVHLAPGAGRYGGALRFERKTDELVAFQGARNVAYRSNHWSGTVSFWLRVSPDADLAPDYCDPLQITPRNWNDASFFTDFTKDEKPRHFRLGALADLPVWNPKKRDWDSLPATEKPLVTVVHPPFSRDRWTHVAFTWDHYNTGQADAVTRFYLDGQLQGEIPLHLQTFTWDMEKCLIMLGLGYTGWMDDLALFDRALSPNEITTLNQLPGGVGQLPRRSKP